MLSLILAAARRCTPILHALTTPRVITTLATSIWLTGCSSFATSNDPLPEIDAREPSRASFAVAPRGTPDVMVVLALSGGGSRAAYLSGAIMLELERVFPDVNLLHEVDAISAVSGGAVAAAYYCLSRDPDVPDDGMDRRLWEPDSVRDLMGRNYLMRWMGNMLWPTNALLYWFTAFDRTDIMAQTLADSLFDHPYTGGDFSLGELAADRPHLLINATDATETTPAYVDDEGVPQPKEPHYGNVFTFTREDFERVLASDVDSYSVARAVMASATFPSAFQYMTLRDYRDTHGERFVHVFDGGNADNLGLKSVERLLREAEETWPAKDRPRRYVVISVDAYTSPRGVDRDRADPRGYLDYFVDRNFLDSIDVMMAHGRLSTLQRFSPPEALQSQREQAVADTPVQWTSAGSIKDPQALQRALGDEQPRAEVELESTGFVPTDLGNRLFFWHLDFTQVDDPDLRERLNDIPTDFCLPDGADADLDRAAHELVHDEVMLARLREALSLSPLDP